MPGPLAHLLQHPSKSTHCLVLPPAQALSEQKLKNPFLHLNEWAQPSVDRRNKATGRHAAKKTPEQKGLWLCFSPVALMGDGFLARLVAVRNRE